MRNPGRGGMQSSGTHYSIYCPKCGKPAARMETREGGDTAYMHFTRKGTVWHIVKAREGGIA